MRTESQGQRFREYNSRKATSQFPRNARSVALWMAEQDRQRGERIRDLREAHAWTQRQLADKLQVDPKTVHNWEAGKELNPTNLRELAELLKVPMDYIRFGERGVPDLTDMFASDPEALSQLDRIEERQEQILGELRALRLQLAAPSQRRAARTPKAAPTQTEATGS